MFCLLSLAFALDCWSCNSFNSFCGDPFERSKLSTAEKLVSLVDCGSNGRCVKRIFKTPGKCFYIKQN